MFVLISQQKKYTLEEEGKLSSHPAHWSPWHNFQMVIFRFFDIPPARNMKYIREKKKLRFWGKR